MCGLTALIFNELSKKTFIKDLNSFENLTKLASERGRDTSGVYLVLRSVKDDDIFSFTIKADGTANYIFHSFQYLEIKKQIAEGLLVLLLAVSHTRMATVGNTEDTNQNQPLISETSKLFFNGIVVNDLLNDSSLYLSDNINDGWRYINFAFEHIDEKFGIANLIRFNENKGILEVFTNNGDLFKVNFGEKTFI
jgi:glutamine phosphoribosylpyrophosphate amidotransferase